MRVSGVYNGETGGHFSIAGHRLHKGLLRAVPTLRPDRRKPLFGVLKERSDSYVSLPPGGCLVRAAMRIPIGFLCGTSTAAGSVHGHWTGSGANSPGERIFSAS